MNRKTLIAALLAPLAVPNAQAEVSPGDASPGSLGYAVYDILNTETVNGTSTTYVLGKVLVVGDQDVGVNDKWSAEQAYWFWAASPPTLSGVSTTSCQFTDSLVPGDQDWYRFTPTSTTLPAASELDELPGTGCALTDGRQEPNRKFSTTYGPYNLSDTNPNLPAASAGNRYFKIRLRTAQTPSPPENPLYIGYGLLECFDASNAEISCDDTGVTYQRFGWAINTDASGGISWPGWGTTQEDRQLLIAAGESVQFEYISSGNDDFPTSQHARQSWDNLAQ